MIFTVGPSDPLHAVLLCTSKERSVRMSEGSCIVRGEGDCLWHVLVSTTTGTLDLTWRGTFRSLKKATRRTGSRGREE